jgi:hypothetical protein
MMNPALIEMMAKDRSRELQAVAANRPSRSVVRTATVTRPALSRSGRHVRLANPQRAIGWFLVSVGLRLAMPRTPTGPAR